MLEATPKPVTAEPSMDVNDRTAVSTKMSTFVSVKNLVDSRRYAEFMSTFVYLPRKDVSRKIKGLASKNVYFCILLTTFHVGRGAVSC